ncbi:MAG TPA: ATP-binding cassette domain-containing protein [Burkholderiales bacterium]|nr:ATP-binding cassette domain-containing protein [Burkholderiales bacterium]
MLYLRGVRKSYGANQVVCGIDLELSAGECFGLLGPNGAGKTTTLRLALGLTDPDAGEIRLLGRAVPRHAREARLRVGVLPQTDNLDPDFTVFENLLVYGRYFGLNDGDIEARIPPLLEFAGLDARAGARIQTLSGGMKRRLSLARALINDPELIFLDEPTTGLDPQARHLIWERLKRLLVRGKTILLTTHFMDEAERLCRRLAVMDHGSIIAEGSPQQLIARHIEPQVVEIYGDGTQSWMKEHGRSLCGRCEQVGETVFCYTRDGDRVLATLDGREELRYPHRRANLEDVFLKLTGRDLRD